MRTTTTANRWSVILAGGDGVRLRPLTRLVSGDDRPKQFCRLVGSQSLLAQTRARSAQLVPPERTLLVFTQQHERYFSEELAADPASHAIVQPSNRGTAPAILWSLLHVAHVDPNAVVAFFPSDHHYSRECRFMAGVSRAFKAAEKRPESVLLLGAKATAPETAYGWIESAGRAPVRRIGRFWEKPCLETAQELLRRGCLWNTFVMAGHVSAFLSLIRQSVPSLVRIFETLHVGDVYNRIESCDFAREILSRVENRLSVISLGDVGWSDLGEPGRAMAVLSEQRIPHYGELRAQLSAAAG